MRTYARAKQLFPWVSPCGLHFEKKKKRMLGQVNEKPAWHFLQGPGPASNVSSVLLATLLMYRNE